DMWMRLCRDDQKIEKTSESLLKYRIHKKSLSISAARRIHPALQRIIARTRFLFGSIRSLKLNYFVVKTIFSSFKDLGYFTKQKTNTFLRSAKWMFTINPIKAHGQWLALKRQL